MEQNRELLNWIALSLYDAQSTETDPEDKYDKDELKQLSVEILGDLYDSLRENMPIDMLDRTFTLVLDYAECRSKAFFIDGIETGLKLQQEVSSV